MIKGSPDSLFKRSLLLFLILWILPDPGSATKTDSLLKALENAKDDGSRISIFNELAGEYASNKPDSAIKWARKALKLSKKTDHKKGLAKALSKLGLVHQNKGEYGKALEHYVRSRKLYEEIGDKMGLAGALGSIGNINYFQHNFKKAREYWEETYTAYKELGKRSNVAGMLDNIGVTFKQMEQFDSARTYHNKAYKIRKDLGEKKGMAQSLNNIGIAYAMQGQLKEALEYFEKAYEEIKDTDHRRNKANFLISIGEAHSDIGDRMKDEGKKEKKIDEHYQKALENFRKSLSISKEIGARRFISSAYQNMAQVLESQGQYQEALAHYKKFKAVRDTIEKKAKENRIAELQTKFETKKKERENKLLRKERKLQNKELQQQRLIIYGSGGAAVAAVFVILVVYRLYKAKKKTSLELEQKNISITRQKEEIQRINTELEKLSIVASETDNSIFIMDTDGELEWANRGFVKMFQFSLEEFKERYGSNIRDISSDPKIEEHFDRCVEQKRSVTYQSVNMTKDGAQFWVQTTITPILNDDGSIRKLVAIDSDITRLKEAESIIRERNREITDSINYARRIQNALLPTQQYFSSLFKDSFFLFKPQSIVSGDFYWAHNLPGDKVAWIAADCTGHGVPGAFMSMIGNQLLNEIVIDKGLTDPGIVFDRMKSSIVETLHKQEKQEVMKDGMDATLCILDRKTNKLWGAGANNPLYVVRNGIGKALPEVNTYRRGEPVTMERTLIKPFRRSEDGVEIEPDKQAIGYEEGKDETFTTFEVQLQKDDVLYTFSDGYADQFGGPKGKKFRYGPFKQLLVEIHQQDLETQKRILDERFEAWKQESDQEQIDDVVVIGVRV